MERLNRGLVAIHHGGGRVFVSWRLLGTDPDGVAFNVYRIVGNAAPVRVNAAPLTEATSISDSIFVTASRILFLQDDLGGLRDRAKLLFASVGAKTATPAAVLHALHLRRDGRVRLIEVKGRRTFV